ncbi:hypothetical protein HSE3_gp116 [Bacillus phage vB_BceM-HSE3]|nr:hypothetical protein HSE3_gp116 [Bacillus phage vB_BceM-HSE3]
MKSKNLKRDFTVGVTVDLKGTVSRKGVIDLLNQEQESLFGVGYQERYKYIGTDDNGKLAIYHDEGAGPWDKWVLQRYLTDYESTIYQSIKTLREHFKLEELPRVEEELPEIEVLTESIESTPTETLVLSLEEEEKYVRQYLLEVEVKSFSLARADCREEFTKWLSKKLNKIIFLS